jgi:hypothetical protein
MRAPARQPRAGGDATTRSQPVIFVVVTATHPEDMAAAVPGQVARVNPASPNGPLLPFTDLELMLGMRVANFTLGEVLLCGDDGRELVGDGRKPSKWFCTTETYTDLGAAVARAREVRDQ